MEPFAPDDSRILFSDSILFKHLRFWKKCLILTAINYADPIDCVSDPCHLAWLVRDNPTLLKATPGVECSNGTQVKDLNPGLFASKKS